MTTPTRATRPTPKAIPSPILAPSESGVTHTLLVPGEQDDGVEGGDAEVVVAVAVDAGTAVVIVVTTPFVNVLVTVLVEDGIGTTVTGPDPPT
jgi:hypothetical protein